MAVFLPSGVLTIIGSYTENIDTRKLLGYTLPLPLSPNKKKNLERALQLDIRHIYDIWFIFKNFLHGSYEIKICYDYKKFKYEYTITHVKCHNYGNEYNVYKLNHEYNSWFKC
jgi:hypothetical protein